MLRVKGGVVIVGRGGERSSGRGRAGLDSLGGGDEGGSLGG